MPRYARLHAPGALVHVIARFVNRAFRLAGDDERTFYLAALGGALVHTDWTLLAYALMSSHVHLALLAGSAPPWHLLKRLHVKIAQGINRLQGTLGPVFAHRPTTIVMPPSRTGSLVGYLHNNPVRAGVSADAASSSWTSHRAWVGLDVAPAWLAVELGLRTAGFDVGPLGRLEFDRFVRERAGEPRDDTHARRRIAETRARARALVGLPIEISSPLIVDAAEGVSHLVLGGSGPARPRWEGDLGLLVPLVATRVGVDPGDVRSRRRAREVVRARRLAGIVGVRVLGRPTIEVASVLGISGSALTQLLGASEAVGALLEAAAEIAGELERASVS